MNAVEEVVGFLNRNKLSVTTAESCTAGMAAALMANVSGCGSALHSGYIAYTEEAKIAILGVNPQTIDGYGLTSEEVAREMALGALSRTSATLALSITGTAESDDCLNGVVCFAYALRTSLGYRLMSETQSFDGPRNQVRTAAAHYAVLALPNVCEKIHSYPEITTC